MPKTFKANFKARSHILSLLGDELIGSDNLALFELVKNSYDADATHAKISFNNLNKPNAEIIIEDDGIGMSLDVLYNSWFEIGTDYKRGNNRKKSLKFGRESLGEKGVGRLAVHKLATDIVLFTRKEGEDIGYKVELNWPDLLNSSKYIEDTEVTFKEKNNLSFLNQQHGTKIILKNLRKTKWERGDIRSLYRTVNTLISPFESVDSFHVEFDLEEDYLNWIEDIFDPQKILNTSIYEYSFYLSKDGTYSYEYIFRPPFENQDLKPNALNNFHEKLKDRILINSEDKKEAKIFREKDLDEIGPIKGKFYLFNQKPQILNIFSNNEAIKNYLSENHGIRMYRDRLRIYNYGEPGNDWLGLNLLRTNNPSGTISNNNVIGSIQIEMTYSHEYLKEKTNREGFDENQTYLQLKKITLSIVKHFATIIQEDRKCLDDALKEFKPVKKAGFSESINELKIRLEKKKLGKEFRTIVTRIEDDYNQMRDVMLSSGLSGMNLSLIFHELLREVKSLNHDINKIEKQEIESRINFLYNLIEGFSPILKQNRSSKFDIKKLFGELKNHVSGRLDYHNIVLSCPPLTDEADNFKITGQENLLFGAINNILDNSIYWVSLRFEKDKSTPPAIFLSTDTQSFNGPAIIIADNGEGFKLNREELTRPFKTLKPGGIGLGLYYASLVMELLGGELLFFNPSDIKIPSVYNGALVVLVFNPSDK